MDSYVHSQRTTTGTKAPQTGLTAGSNLVKTFPTPTHLTAKLAGIEEKTRKLTHGHILLPFWWSWSRSSSAHLCTMTSVSDNHTMRPGKWQGEWDKRVPPPAWSRRHRAPLRSDSFRITLGAFWNNPASRGSRRHQTNIRLLNVLQRPTSGQWCVNVTHYFCRLLQTNSHFPTDDEHVALLPYNARAHTHTWYVTFFQNTLEDMKRVQCVCALGRFIDL